MTGADPGSLDAAAAERWLSGPRYRRYLSVAAGDHDLAMAVYVWNSRVAAAGAIDLGHLEVLSATPTTANSRGSIPTGRSIQQSACSASSRVSRRPASNSAVVIARARPAWPTPDVGSVRHPLMRRSWPR